MSGTLPEAGWHCEVDQCYSNGASNHYEYSAISRGWRGRAFYIRISLIDSNQALHRSDPVCLAKCDAHHGKNGLDSPLIEAVKKQSPSCNY